MKYSLVIPTYNGQEYVEQAILSGILQKEAFDEIIVSDDNSFDSTFDICKKYQNIIKLYKNLEGPSGFVNGWNHALEKASGDYISILHQDDLLDPTFLLEVKAIIKNNSHIKHLFTTCKYINEFNEITGYSFDNEMNNIVEYTGLEYVKTYQTQGSPHIHRCPGVLTHRSIFDKMKYNPNAGHIADDDFFFRVGEYTNVIGLLKPLASYRLHNLSETGSLKDFQLVNRLLDDYIYQVKQWKDSDFMDKEVYSYFLRGVRKNAKRLFAYGLTKRKISWIRKALPIYLEYLIKGY